MQICMKYCMVALIIHFVISKIPMLSFCFCLWQLVCEVFLYYLHSLSGSLFCILIKSLCLQGFKTKDGYLVVAAGNDQQFMKVCKVSRHLLSWTPNMHINKSNQALFVHFSHSHILQLYAFVLTDGIRFTFPNSSVIERVCLPRSCA